MSCPECFQGVTMADYQPKGEVTTIHGRETYVAKPSGQAKGIVIIIPDAFGLPFLNNKHLADTYASDGQFLVYLPDFMDGHSAPVSMLLNFAEVMKDDKTLYDWVLMPYYVAGLVVNMVPFIYHNRFPYSMPKVQDFFEKVRENESKRQNLPIGAAGFCWGGQHTFALASGEYKSKQSGKVLCDAHFTAHASNVSVPADAKKVILPLSMAAGTTDKVMTLKQAQEVEALLREKMDKGEAKNCEVVYYKGAGHGFGVRADPGNKEVVKHAADSVKQAINFYTKVFSEWKGL